MAPYDAGTYKRARAAGIAAKNALDLARWVVADRLDIDIDRPLTIERDGFTVTLKATSDDYMDLEDMGYGRFEDGTEDWRTGYYHADTPGAIPNPNGDRSPGGGARFYIPANPRADAVAYHRKAGASKSVALDLARESEADELSRLSEWGPTVVVLRATVSRAGIKLGSASLGGIEIGWSDITRTDGTEYLAEVAEDIIPEAIDEAREALNTGSFGYPCECANTTCRCDAGSCECDTEAPPLDGVAPHIPGTDYYDGRDGSIEAEEDDEESIADQEAHREEWREFLSWQRDLGA